MHSPFIRLSPFRSPRRRLAGLAVVALAAGCGHHSTTPSRETAALLRAPEHYAHSIAALGWPGARRAFQIGNGSVAGTGEFGIEWSVPGDAARLARTPVWFERDGVPVAHWFLSDAEQSLHLEAAAMPEPALGDTSLLLVARVTATRTARTRGEVRFEAHVVSRARGPGFIPWDAPGDTAFAEAWSGSLALRNERVVAGFDADRVPAGGSPTTRTPAHSTNAGQAALAASYRTTLDPGESHSWSFWIPAYPLSPALGSKIARAASFERTVTQSRAAWRATLARAATLSTPDTLVDAAYRAALVTLVIDQERAGADTMPIGNPFHYRDTWLRDGAQVVRALAVAGLTDLARADAWSFRRYQLPGGALLSHAGQLDGTGQALWAFGQAASLPPDPEWARRVLPVAVRGGEWIERQRRFSRDLQLPWAGLLPYANPRDNEMVRAQLVGNDAWAYAGERALVRLARLAGDDTLAAHAEETSGDYRRTFDAALIRTHSPDVPPSWQGAGRDWGNLSVGYPARLLPENDPHLTALARRIWSEGAGLATYGTRDSLHTYFSADLAEWALLADRGADAAAVLADMLRHASSTLGHSEVLSRSSGDFGLNLPPHGTAAARLVQLVRDMIVCDVRDTLELGLGMPPSWWNGTRLAHAPTRFGVIDLELSRPAAERLAANWTAVDVPARIRVPDHVHVTRVLTSDARLVGGHWIECQPRSSRALFEVAPGDAQP